MRVGNRGTQHSVRVPGVLNTTVALESGIQLQPQLFLTLPEKTNTLKEKSLEIQRTDYTGFYIWSLSKFGDLGDWRRGGRITMDLGIIRASSLQLFIVRPGL